MSFQGKYRIVAALSAGETESFRAVQISSGRPVLLHHLSKAQIPPVQPDLASLIFKFLCTGSSEGSRHLLDMGEEEGRTYLVTADVPECLDLRQWLVSVTEAGAAQKGDAQPAPEAPGPGGYDSTRTYTTETFRQSMRLSASVPVPSPSGPNTAPPTVPTPEKSPGILVTPPVILPAPPKARDSGPTDFASLWEKSSAVKQPASIPSSASGQKGSVGPSEVPEVTAEFLSGRPSLNVQDAPTSAMPTLQAQSANRDRAAAAGARPADAKGKARQFAEVAPQYPEVMKRPPAADTAEIATRSPQPSLGPDAIVPKTIAPKVIAELLVKNDNPQAVASASPPRADAKQEADKVPRLQSPMGFEGVFQSNPPPSRSPLSGWEGQSALLESEPAARSIPASPLTPPRPAPLAQPVAPDLKKGGTPPTSTPMPTPTISAQRSEYTRMMENIKGAANSPPPMGPPEDPLASYQPAANPEAPAPTPIQASRLNVSAPQTLPNHQASTQFQPAPYVANGTLAHPAVRRRKNWVPILILSGLLLWSAALVLFFAIKR